MIYFIIIIFISEYIYYNSLTNQGENINQKILYLIVLVSEYNINQKILYFKSFHK